MTLFLLSNLHDATDDLFRALHTRQTINQLSQFHSTFTATGDISRFALFRRLIESKPSNGHSKHLFQQGLSTKRRGPRRFFRPTETSASDKDEGGHPSTAASCIPLLLLMLVRLRP